VGRPSTIHVLATTPLDTRAALTTASQLAGWLGAMLRVIVPEVVSYGLRVESPAPDPTTVADVYRMMASRMGIVADVRLCVCRRKSDVYHVLLPQRSVIVMGGRRRRWPWANATDRTARTLENLGHHVFVVERG